MKYFSMQVLLESHNSNWNIQFVAMVWKWLAPPKAKLIVWLVHLQHLDTKDRLCILNILQPVEVVCPFCFAEVESIHHLFLSYVRSWNLWCTCLE